MLRLPHTMVCCSRSTVTGSSGVRFSAAMISAASSSVTIAVSEPVLHGIAGKDVAERRRDHATDAVVVERIDRGLARRAAAEISPADDDLGIAPCRPVDREVRLLLARPHRSGGPEIAPFRCPCARVHFR